MTKTPKQPKSAYGEPWNVVYLDSDDAKLFCTDECSADLPTRLARIAACVNFCRQFPTNWLAQHQLHYADSAVNAAQVQNYAGLVIVTRNDDEKRLNAEHLAAKTTQKPHQPSENDLNRAQQVDDILREAENQPPW